MDNKLLVCCGMPRSGSTLQYQIVVEILKFVSMGKGIGWAGSCSSDELFSLIDNTDDWLVTKVHDRKQISNVEKITHNERVRFFYSYRDMRDVIISAARKERKTTLSLILSEYLEHLLNNYYFWTRIPEVYVTKYETMISDLYSEVKKVADYLQINLKQEEIIEISKKLSLENQLKRIEILNGEGMGDDTFDPETLFYSNHIYSSKPQQWKSGLTPIEIALIEVKAHKWLVEKEYGISQPKFLRKFAYLLYIKHWRNNYLKEALRRIGYALYERQDK